MAFREFSNIGGDSEGHKYFAPMDAIQQSLSLETVWLVTGFLFCLLLVVLFRRFFQRPLPTMKQLEQQQKLRHRPVEKESEPPPAEAAAPPPTAPAPADTGGGTFLLRSGDKLRLHFDSQPGTFTCTTINVAKDSFVVTLPKVGEQRPRPAEGEKVEGFMTINNAFFSFESLVKEVFRGGVFACRILHAGTASEIYRRQSIRVPVEHKILFAHFSNTAPETQAAELEHMVEQTQERWEGVLRDISLGGCALSTLSRHRFEAGDLLQFNLKILADEPACTIMGTIIMSKPRSPAEGGGLSLHIEFINLDDETQAIVDRTVSTLDKQSRPAEPPTKTAPDVK